MNMYLTLFCTLVIQCGPESFWAPPAKFKPTSSWRSNCNVVTVLYLVCNQFCLLFFIIWRHIDNQLDVISTLTNIRPAPLISLSALCFGAVRSVENYILWTTKKTRHYCFGHDIFRFIVVYMFDVAREAFERHLLILNRRLWRSNWDVPPSVVGLVMVCSLQSTV